MKTKPNVGDASRDLYASPPADETWGDVAKAAAGLSEVCYAAENPALIEPHLEQRPSGIIVPTRPGKKTLLEIKKALYPRHPESERVFRKAGQDLTYIPWHEAVRILDKATGGFWTYKIDRMDTTEKYAVVAVTLTLHASDGDFSYDGQGLEPWSTTGYGDPLSNAESMAFRRACAKAGLGLYLYKKD